MNLRDYDVILVNSSAGKDSQTALRVVAEMAEQQGVTDRVTVVHANLGRVEWPDTEKLADDQALHYGLPFEQVRREKGDLLDQVRQRGMWPDMQNRYCTSDQKRDQVAKVITAKARAVGAGARILNVMGIRADESPTRRKMPPLERDSRLSNGRKTVDRWLPIHDWSVDQVWASIRASGVPYHRAYDLGMPRLSCCFCVFAPKSALMVAGTHNPELLDAYVEVEEEIGHTFRKGFRIAEVRNALRSGEKVERVESWTM